MDGTSTASSRRFWQRHWVRWLFSITALLVLAALATLQYVASHAEPILRKRIIETVSERFNSPVELDRVEISAMKGLQVTGDGLRVLHIAGADRPSPSQPSQLMLTVRQFRFRTDIFALLHATTHLGLVDVEGVEVHIPPSDQRGPLLARPRQGVGSADASHTATEPKIKPKITVLISHIVCDNARLFIEASKPGKAPLEFDIQHVDLTDLDWRKPFQYDATLTNAKPTGLIHAVGTFGPWQDDHPRDTPIDGNYSFDHADLNTIKGIGGTLSSTGHFGGALGGITVDGTTDTPNFSLDTSNHAVPLHTQFHAIVDGTTGDTTLAPVQARLLHSSFTARGVIRNVAGKGHDISLDVDVPAARIDDMLLLAVKTSPPLMRGALTMKARLHIPPGPGRVVGKLELAGRFNISHVSFSNPKMQSKVDSLSLRAQGRPEDAQDAARDEGRDSKAQVASQMNADFKLEHAMTTVENLHYQIPGALVLMNGVYSLDGQVFEFKGHVRTEATASQMTTGWKSILLMPVDRFLKKNGAGMELPIQISGTQSEPHIGLEMHGANESAAEMEKDVRAKTEADKESARTSKKMAKR